MFSNFQSATIKISKYLHSKRQQFKYIFFDLPLSETLKLRCKAPKLQHFNFSIFNLSIVLFGPKLLLGRTSFSVNLLLGAYCIAEMAHTNFSSSIRKLHISPWIELKIKKELKTNVQHFNFSKLPTFRKEKPEFETSKHPVFEKS